jgi:hypothetical protein
VLDALDSIQPVAVLIEGPADADDVLQFALAPGMRPPLALLIHATDDPARAMFYPFAEYSPEWQALRYAVDRKVITRFIDLPAAYQFATPATQDAAEEPGATAEEDFSPLTRDPLGTLAAAAGESDGEAWWNALVEQRAHSRDVFPVIADAMTTVRQALEAEPTGSTRETIREERREAHMRLRIREALRATDGPVAVICGAWHVPALLAAAPFQQDRDTLKGLARTKTSATWVPWTDTRLAVASGYGAGVISPGWYRHLWRSRSAQGIGVGEMTARWQSSVSDLLRKEGLPSAPASVIEASRLAISLASVRGFAVPGDRSKPTRDKSRISSRLCSTWLGRDAGCFSRGALRG